MNNSINTQVVSDVSVNTNQSDFNKSIEINTRSPLSLYKESEYQGIWIKDFTIGFVNGKDILSYIEPDSRKHQQLIKYGWSRYLNNSLHFEGVLSLDKFTNIVGHLCDIPLSEMSSRGTDNISSMIEHLMSQYYILPLVTYKYINFLYKVKNGMYYEVFIYFHEICEN